MKKIFLSIIFLILFSFSATEASASHGVDVDINSSDGHNWTILIGNSGNHTPAGTQVTLEFGAFWCNQTGSSWCDDNSLDYRGLKTIQSLTITVPAQGQINTYTRQFGINTRAGYPCGTVQGDVTQGSGTTGNLWWSRSNCNTSATLTPLTSSCVLRATWDLGFNDNANCQIKIEAGGTLYRLSDTRCNGSLDLSGNISTPQGNLSIHSGGIYKLHAGSKSSDSRTLDCTANTTNTPAPTEPTEFNVTCSGSPSSGTAGQTTITWTARIFGALSSPTYSWLDNEGPIAGNNFTVNKIYSSAGQKTASVTVTSGTNSETVTCTPTITINPAGTITNSISVSPSSVSRPDSTSPWNTSSLSINVNVNKTPTGNVFYKKADSVTPGPCSGSLCDGWASVREPVSTGTFPWPIPLSLPDGKYAYGLFDSSKSEILAVSYATFTTGTITTAPTDPAGCTLGVSDYNAAAGSTLNITSNNPSAPYRINVDGPSSVYFGPYNSSSGQATWYTSGYPGGSYTVSNGCTSKTVTLSLSCATSDSFQATIQTFLEPKYVTEQWPQQIWNPRYANRYYCWSGTEGQDFGDTQGISTNRQIQKPTLPDQILQFIQNIAPKITILPPTTIYAWHPVPSPAPGTVGRGEACTNDNQCQNATVDPCNEIKCNETGEFPRFHGGVVVNGNETFSSATCSVSPKPQGAICGATETGKNLYCGNWTQCYKTPELSYCNSDPTVKNKCVVQQCKTNADCNDNNVCTGGATGEDECVGYDPGGLRTEEGCDEGGCALYTYEVPEKMGQCNIVNKLPTTVCQTDASGKPTKLCSQSGGYNGSFDQTTNKMAYSTCSVNYYQCSDVRGSSNECCGIQNVQGMQCQGYCQNARFPTSWNKDSSLPFNGPPNDFPIQPLAGATVKITDERNCVTNITPKQTDSSGLATFVLPRNYPDKNIQYTVEITNPAGSNLIFTRGVDAIDKGDWEQNPGRGTSSIITPINKTTPSFNRLDSGGANHRVTFGFEQSLPVDNSPWIQTTGGNVYSSDRIKAENGP